MKTNRTLKLAVLAAVALFGVLSCNRVVIRTIAIDSDPRGARIEMDGEYVGEAPCAANVQVKQRWVGVAYSPDGYDLDYGDMYRKVVLRATPIVEGQYTQVKVLSLRNIAAKDVTHVFFDMRLEPVPEQYQFDIRNR